MNRDIRVELVALVLYAAVLYRMDKTSGMRTAAGWYLRGAHTMRNVSSWAATTAIRWENAAKELVAP